MSKYFGSWDRYEAMRDDFFRDEYSYVTHDYKTVPPPDGFPTPDQVLFASYGGAAYEGDAEVIFQQGDKLFTVHGSHCSCYGLEDQWEPVETTWQALRLAVDADAERKKTDKHYYYRHILNDHEPEAVEAYEKLVRGNT